MKPRARLCIEAAIAVLGAACSNSASPSTGEPAQVATVEVVNIAFEPSMLEVDRGTEVIWTNQDDGVHHTVTSGLPGDNGVPGVSEGQAARPDGVFHGDLPDAGSELSFRFTQPGTYAYFCRVHPSMTGEVVVD